MKKLAIFAIVILLLASIFVGCTENYSAKRIDGPSEFDKSDVESNGGLALKAVSDGVSYVYYVNGYATQTGENVFGKALKGAILRATLDENGHVDYADSVVTVVPKNIYAPQTVSGSYTASGSTKSVVNKTAGVFTDGEYFYYTTPSTKKDSEGAYKTSEMMLMRTAIDGTDTKQIAYFTHFNVLYNVYNGYLVYFDATSKELHRVNLDKMKDEKIDSDVRSVVFCDYTARADDNLFFYVKTSEDKDNTNYSIIYRATVDGSIATSAYLSGIDHEELRKAQIDADSVDKGFKYSVVELKRAGDTLMLVFDKTDSGSNTLSQGLYTMEVSLTSSYRTVDEVLLSTNGKGGNDDQYSSFYFVSDKVLLASTSSATYLLNKTSDGWTKAERTDSKKLISSSVNILNVNEENGVYAICYLNSSGKVQKMNAFTLDDEGKATIYAGTQPVVDVVTSMSVNTSSFKAERIGDAIYYFNSGAQNYAFAYYLDTVTADAPVYKQEDAQNRFISLATDEDLPNLIA